jgi:osmotically-inducible protein OsmY
MQTTLSKSDELVRRDVERELQWDTRVDATDVGVTVAHGVVTLLGTVPSDAARHAALAAAFRVAGVHDVANELEVKLPGSAVRSDAEIALAVRHALTWDVYLDQDRIHSTVANGWVTLTGEVPGFQQEEDVVRAARRLTGVRGVTDLLTVTVPPVPPATIKRAIEEALERRVERELERITVAVEDGVVTLRGRVNSWAERRDAVGAARHARGVRDVRDELVVTWSL